MCVCVCVFVRAGSWVFFVWAVSVLTACSHLPFYSDAITLQPRVSFPPLISAVCILVLPLYLSYWSHLYLIYLYLSSHTSLPLSLKCSALSTFTRILWSTPFFFFKANKTIHEAFQCWKLKLMWFCRHRSVTLKSFLLKLEMKTMVSCFTLSELCSFSIVANGVP